MSSLSKENSRTFLWNRLNNGIVWFKSETQEHEKPSVTLRSLHQRLDSQIRRHSQLAFEHSWNIFLQSASVVRNVVHQLAPTIAPNKEASFLELRAHQQRLTSPAIVDKARRSHNSHASTLISRVWTGIVVSSIYPSNM
jgi:hypothetical protein